MPDTRSHTATLLTAVVAAVGLLGLVACGSESSESVQRPANSSAAAQVAGKGSASLPTPPQPSHQPPQAREAVRVPGSDGTLASMVESAIAAEPELNTLGIDVTAVDGTVYLRGQARTRETRRLATEVASKVDGVERVQNELFVMAGSAPEPRRNGELAVVR